MIKVKRYLAGLVTGLIIASSSAWAIPWIAQGLNVSALGDIGATSVTVSGLTASLPVFTNGSKTLASNAMTGTGNVVMSTSPTLVTPTLGAALATSISIGSNVYMSTAEALVDEGTITLPTITDNYSGHGFVRVSSAGVVQDSAEFESGSDGNVSLIRGTANVVIGAACADTKICISTAAAQNPIIIKARNGAANVQVEFWYR
jgi:hypothetical protein